MSNLESFFDDDLSGNYNLWSKDCEEVDLKKETVIFKGYQYKFSKAKNKWKQRYFILTKRFLLYYKVASASPD